MDMVFVPNFMVDLVHKGLFPTVARALSGG